MRRFLAALLAVGLASPIALVGCDNPDAAKPVEVKPATTPAPDGGMAPAPAPAPAPEGGAAPSGDAPK